VHSVGQRQNLKHLCEPLGGTEGLIKTVGFKKRTECMWWRTSANRACCLSNTAPMHCIAALDRT